MLNEKDKSDSDGSASDSSSHNNDEGRQRFKKRVRLEGHSFGVDVWAVGVIMYTMLIGHPPFETDNVTTTYRRIKNGQFSFPDEEKDDTYKRKGKNGKEKEKIKISDEAKNMIRSLLTVEENRRPTLKDV
jgi:polo-like kinase 1